MKFVVGENGRNPMKNLPRPRFVHHKTHMEGPRRELGTPAVGGERLTACATRLPRDFNLGQNFFTFLLVNVYRMNCAKRIFLTCTINSEYCYLSQIWNLNFFL